MVSRAKYTILKIASYLNIVIFSSKDKCLIRHNLITLHILLIVVEKFNLSRIYLNYLNLNYRFSL